MLEEGYLDIERALVDLTITEPFVIKPSYPVFILPTSKFVFQLQKVTIRNNEMDFTTIQDLKKYSWAIDQQSKGYIADDGTFISYDKEGVANIKVTDKTIPNNTADGSVNVVFPFLLEIEIVDITD